MSITIIKGGKNEFVGHCKWCGCDFRYTAEDVLKTVDKIECPFCHRQLDHCGENGTNAWYPHSAFGWGQYTQGQPNLAAQQQAAYMQQRADLMGMQK